MRQSVADSHTSATNPSPESREKNCEQIRQTRWGKVWTKSDFRRRDSSGGARKLWQRRPDDPGHRRPWDWQAYGSINSTTSDWGPCPEYHRLDCQPNTRNRPKGGGPRPKRDAVLQFPEVLNTQTIENFLGKRLRKVDHFLFSVLVHAHIYQTIICSLKNGTVFHAV